MKNLFIGGIITIAIITIALLPLSQSSSHIDHSKTYDELHRTKAYACGYLDSRFNRDEFKIMEVLDA